jgi:hypothetical protein
MPAGRPKGISSRLHSVPPRGSWTAPNGQVVGLPLILDILEVSADGARVEWKVEATVDLVAGEPRLVALVMQHPSGFDVHRMRREFRWATPLEVVTRTVPSLMARDVDPFQHDYAVTGYPDAADPGRAPGRELSTEFLEEVARRYLALGRGYADELAAEYSVSRRTVISWVEKARTRGILTATTPGAVGGHIRGEV